MNEAAARYTARFEELLFSRKPQSVLDVGCGRGEFLSRAKARGVEAVGVDTSPERVSEVRATGLAAHVAGAEALPFNDGQFDWCICSRSAHHFADLGAGLREVLRVSQRGVLIYDPWFDETIPSQAAAADLDRLYKTIDGAHGHANNGPLTGADFAAAADGLCRLTIEYWLELQSANLDELEARMRHHISEHGAPDVCLSKLDQLARVAGSVGLSEAGAIIVTLHKPT